jgi:hypothetical protein
VVMTMKRKAAMLALIVFGNIGMLLGFSTFYYQKRSKSFINSKALLIHGKFMALAFFVIYPNAIRKTLGDNFLPRTVTDYARVALSISFWLIGFVIYLNQTSNSTTICEIYNRALTLYRRYDTDGNINSSSDDGILTKCAFRAIVLLVGFFVINFLKIDKNLLIVETFFDRILYCYMFLPYIMVSLTANRLYSAANYFLFLIKKGNEKLLKLANDYGGNEEIKKSLLNDLQNSTRNYSELHQLFVDFHQLHKKYMMHIVCFCIFNIIFEVRRKSLRSF